jgi:hypothetical protein
MIRMSLAQRGAFRPLLDRWHVTRRGREDLTRTALVLAAVAWLPLFAAGVADVVTTGVVPPMLLDLSVHARCLVAIPAILVADHVLAERCQRAVERLVESDLLGPGTAGLLAPIARRAERLGGARAVELVLMAAAIFAGVSALASETTGLFHVAGGTAALPARLWYALVSLALYRFLMVRWLWRWAIWSWVLWRISRAPLRPMMTHPDHAGGLSLLAEPTVAFAVFAFASSSVAAGAWASQLAGGVPIERFLPVLALLALLVLLLAFGPLLLFVMPLYRARLAAIRSYDLLAFEYTREYHARWITAAPTRVMRDASPDTQGLADLINAHTSLQAGHVLPFGTRSILLVLLGVVGPMLPLAASQVPLEQLLGHVGRALLGGLPV